MNKFFASAFMMIATWAILGAILEKATWHYGTAIICLFFSWMFYSDSKASSRV